MPKKISRTKEKIFYLMSENCRTPYSELGKQINKSAQYARSLIQGLEAENTLTYYILVDYSLLKLLAFRVYFKGGFTDESELKNLIKQISKSKLVTIIRTISGPYDLQVDFLAPNPSRFNKEIKTLVSARTELTNYDVILYVVSHHFSRAYLTLNTQNKGNTIIGGDRKPLLLDENQKKVLKILIENPRATILSISEKTSLNVRTVINIIKKLESSNVIRGFKAEIDVYKIGYVKNRIILKLHNTNVVSEQRLLNHCIENPNITTFSKTIGSWDIEIDVEAEDNLDFRKIYLEIREKFKDIIQSFNYFSLLDVHKRKYIPDVYFEEQD
ncbi:MAG: Lrp/AsnC family transcriptional regulator [Nanoarchaeota archaeon]|nr:Lrp/AsnC family transcriptional regulator [Nanoarchaeota archaeon]MBU1270471.1 Lrp/AsnC family transcriptional regulator [Nanoarchaeota archaeon]MBU1605052.1 Lrp/AsnC family transcriptional regulator [Nanoarchaeota archaeon]MBU2443705.1 Lrp/AsnC family transcriptional regulator [Nanoarchaeota archaeon]